MDRAGPGPRLTSRGRRSSASFSDRVRPRGYTVKIDTIERQGAELVVTYRERPPAPTDMVAQMLTAPYVLVTIEKFDGRVRFVRAP